MAAEQARTIGLGLLPWLRVWCFRPSKGFFLPAQDPRGEELWWWLNLFKAQLVRLQKGISGCGQHWTRGSSFLLALPSHAPPKSFCPFLVGQKRQRHECPGKEGEKLWSWGATSQSAPLSQAQQDFLMGNWGPEKMEQRWGKNLTPALGRHSWPRPQISLPRRVEGRELGTARTKAEDGQG